MARKKSRQVFRKSRVSEEEAKRLDEIRRKAMEDFPPEPNAPRPIKTGIGARIRAVREAKGLTWYAVAKLVEIPNPGATDGRTGKTCFIAVLAVMGGVLPITADQLEKRGWQYFAPRLDGGWFRAFDFEQWDYWGANGDSGWGAWSSETGWVQSHIVAALAMRQRKTSLWQFTAGSKIAVHFARYRKLMEIDKAVHRQAARLASGRRQSGLALCRRNRRTVVIEVDCRKLDRRTRRRSGLGRQSIVFHLDSKYFRQPGHCQLGVETVV